MNKYITWKETWAILEARELDKIDETTAFYRFINVLRLGFGRYTMINNQLVFIEMENPMNYKYSTSVIGSDHPTWKVEKGKMLVDRIVEERDVVDFYLERINDEFSQYKKIYLPLFFDRYFNSLSVNDIQKKYNISKRKYYSLMEAAEHCFKKAVMIWKPPNYREQIQKNLDMATKIMNENLVNSKIEKNKDDKIE